jgi:hypothetical protein
VSVVRLSCVALAMLCGCAGARHVTVMTVFDHGNCRTDTAGVRLIDYAELAELRGARLLGLSDDAAAHPLHLVAIVPGEYPTTGYALRLVDPQPELSDPLLLHVTVAKPPPDAVLAQVLTHPCLVVGIDDAAVRRVRVDVDAMPLGEIDLSPAPAPSP